MANQVYDREALRKQAVEHLRKAARHQSAGMVSVAIGAQMWAVDQVLEDAYLAKEVTFSAGIGWLAMPVATKTPAAAADGQAEVI